MPYYVIEYINQQTILAVDEDSAWLTFEREHTDFLEARIVRTWEAPTDERLDRITSSH